MDSNFIRETLVGRMRRQLENVDEAARVVKAGLGGMADGRVDEVVAQIRAEARKNRLLVSPRGVHATPSSIEDEVRLADWYTGPEDGDFFWPRLRARMERGPLGSVLDEIDQSSTKVVGNLADPSVARLKSKGLVVGHAIPSLLRFAERNSAWENIDPQDV